MIFRWFCFPQVVQKQTLGEVGNWMVIWCKLCPKYSYQKLLKSVDWFLSYSRKCRRCFFWTQCRLKKWEGRVLQYSDWQLHISDGRLLMLKIWTHFFIMWTFMRKFSIFVRTFSDDKTYCSISLKCMLGLTICLPATYWLFVMPVECYCWRFGWTRAKHRWTAWIGSWQQWDKRWRTRKCW